MRDSTRRTARKMVRCSICQSESQPRFYGTYPVCGGCVESHKGSTVSEGTWNVMRKIIEVREESRSNASN